MNKVQKQIYDNVVKPAINSIPNTLIGSVYQFSHETMTGVVIIEGTSLTNNEYKKYVNVPLSYQQGVKQVVPMPGDLVVLDFLNGNGSTPVISGIVDPRHAGRSRFVYEAHRESGGSLSELYLEREGEFWS